MMVVDKPLNIYSLVKCKVSFEEGFKVKALIN
jgi:hypothetical protein